MNNPVLATESFSHNRKHYFFDFMQAVNGSYYIKISRSDELGDNSYQKKGIVIFQENFEFAIEALSSLFRTAAFQQAANDPKHKSSPYERTTGIKSWDPECRPREKMMEQGREAMADAELLAMLIGSGSPRETAVDLAGRILSSVEHDLKRLSELTVEQLCLFRGMGHAKSLAIISSMELASRLLERQHKKIWLKAVNDH